MASRPVAADKVAVNERLGRSPRVLDPGVQPVLPEETEKVHAADAADRASLRQKIRGQEVADAGARTALAAGVVPGELAVEPEVAAREKVAIEVAEAQLAVDAEEVVRSLLRVGRVIAEAWVDDDGGILAQGQVRASPIEHDRPADAELQERGRRHRQAHSGELGVRM